MGRGRACQKEPSPCDGCGHAPPGERFGHRALLERAWELRATVRGWDAMYVTLAEVLEVPLITLDGRLARATGPRCVIELIS